MIFLLAILILSCLTPPAAVCAGKPALAEGDFIWHWHKQSHPGKDEILKLSELGFSGIFMHAGTFSFYGNKPRYDGFNYKSGTFEDLKAVNSMQFHLVYTFSGSPDFNFMAYFNGNTGEAVEFILQKIESDLRVYGHYGINVSGIQFDMEGRQLRPSSYKKLIDAAAGRFGNDRLISITPQVYLSVSRGFSRLVENADFFVPMLYDYATGKTSRHRLKVTDINWIRYTAKKYRETGKPFYLGIPSYGYSKLYDEKGRLLDAWPKLSVEKLSENPDFRLVKSRKNIIDGTKKTNYDNVYFFRAVRDTTLSNYRLRKGASVKFDVMTPESVMEYLKAAKSTRGKYFLGTALFRYGYSDEELMMNTDQLGGIYGKQALPETLPETDIIYAGGQTLSEGDIIGVNLLLKNTGGQASFTSDDANRLYLELENGGIPGADRGGFDIMENRINTLTAFEKHLHKNEAVISGTVRIRITGFPLKLTLRAVSRQLDGKTLRESGKKTLSVFPERHEVSGH